MERIGKPRNQRTKRVLKAREAKLLENGKCAMIIKGLHTSQTICQVLTDVAALKKPLMKKLNKKNETRPFEDQTSVEFLSNVNDASLFAFGSHSKKRPHNLILGRSFDHQVLDMFELGLDDKTMKPIDAFNAARQAVCHLGSKPMFFFAGDEFETNPDLALFRNFVIDFFQGEPIEKVNLAGLDRVIVCAASDSKTVLFRHYAVALKKSGTKIPKVKLEELGPRLDLTVRRTMRAAESVITAANKRPKIAKSNTQRGNVEKGPLGQTLGRVHVQRQDLDELATRKMKGLKKTKPAEAADDNGRDGEYDDEHDEEDASDVDMDDGQRSSEDDVDEQGSSVDDEGSGSEEEA
ncbi:unnamed protein product (mitochondrion) [Plasmodiophora brassicae]|uniref:Ribosome production factor 2 homolog n=1 Tax=Plasmodiophora brassicae TaxID=37360 RepID=A0A0G4J829_PLABS|nr:hypothetical protein PBRA_003322 [Plasmodiophora brassicae]SPQ99676.1 unnamed protein product [Plasmodiophora brassicae]